MSGFQRFVTYLNLYEENQKIRNTGFAKVEKRNEQCKIEIHMKGAGYTAVNCPVYLYSRQNNKLMGILIGEIQIKNGIGNLQIILTSSNINQSGYSFEQVNGILIAISEKFMIASQWDEREINRSQFIVIPKKDVDSVELQKKEVTIKAAEQKSEPKISASNNIRPQNVRGMRMERQYYENKEALEEGSVKKEEINQPNHNPYRQEKIHRMPQRNKNSQNCMKAMEAAKNIEQENHDSEQEEKLTEEAAAWRQKWQFVLENYPVMTPFEGEENILCVRLELKDIRVLPKRYWYLGNNSFLLHGFFNYRYLLLGTFEEDSKKKWFIGVPGVFQSQEKVMATLFGFPEFKSEKISEHKTGQFGYWYRLMGE